MKITIELYGRLKQTFGKDTLVWQTEADNPKDIYLELCKHHQSADESNFIKPIIDDTFCDWTTTLDETHVLGFLPPASGG